ACQTASSVVSSRATSIGRITMLAESTGMVFGPIHSVAAVTSSTTSSSRHSPEGRAFMSRAGDCAGTLGDMSCSLRGIAGLAVRDAVASFGGGGRRLRLASGEPVAGRDLVEHHAHCGGGHVEMGNGGLGHGFRERGFLRVAATGKDIGMDDRHGACP